ncbi:MAG: AAA family ATPase [Elusimicrobiales bacterium]|nr:AAA family ATPase [Elusimicrobiales bacterium]
MNETTNFTWIPFYREFAKKLLEYRSNRKALIEKIKDIFSKMDALTLPKLAETNKITNIDPFTFFALFNRNIKYNNRVKILSLIKSSFNVYAETPKDFNAIPTMQSINLTFYDYLSDNCGKDIDNLWNLFQIALEYEQNKYIENEFIELFNTVIKQRGVSWNITMGLFWISPYTYLNLDDTNRLYLKNQKIKDFGYNVPDGKTYLDFCRTLSFGLENNNNGINSFPDFSFNAYCSTSQQYWLKSADPDKYDIQGAFDAFGFIDFSQNNTKYNINDTVFIYSSGDERKVRYKTIAERVNIPYEETADDTKFHKTIDVGGSKEDKYVRLRLLKEAEDDSLSYENLKKHGLTGTLRSPLIIKEQEFIDYLNSCFEDKKMKKYWLYRPAEQGRLWGEFSAKSIIGIGMEGLGDLKQYKTKQEINDKLNEIGDYPGQPTNDALCNWQFANEMNIGDIVFVAINNQLKLYGRGIVVSDYIFDDSRIEYKSIRRVEWTHKGEYDINNIDKQQWSIKTLTDISQYGEKVDENFMKPNEPKASHPLNQILYGPPGTGKTYNTVIKAMEIINPGLIVQYKAEAITYDDVKKAFDEAKKNGQIEFVTFHQSYAYEEFVEGIKPDLEESEDLKYELKDGIFKRICKNAETPIVENKAETGIRDNPSIWKISLNGTENNEVKQYCMDNDCIRVSYHKIPEDENEEFDFEKYKDKYLSLKRFKEEMEIGDIVLSCSSLKTIDAIGVITGEYQYNDTFDEYKRCRKVKWLVKGLNYNILKINSGLNFNRKTFHRVNNMSFNDILPLINSKGQVVKYTENRKPYVLIIDEINRGNISKIFGELITLIEPDKRQGAAHEIKAKLPYSQSSFAVPQNLYIIGTMNTSDRSIATVDIALRRRFKFIEMMPDKTFVANFGIGFQGIFEKLNKKIKLLLDRDHQIGHSYFIKTKYENADAETLKQIWFQEILPLLNEYFYCDWEKLKLVVPGFITKVDNIPAELKDECEDSAYEFKTDEDFKDIDDFTTALKQDKFEKGN